jgi:ribosome-associated protein
MTEGKYLKSLVTTALEDLKGVDIVMLDVHKITTITDTMIIASGTSDRHVRALADSVVEAAKAGKHPPIGIEGGDGGEWVLVDLGDLIVHVMLPRVRDFYNLEKLWDTGSNVTHRGARSAD